MKLFRIFQDVNNGYDTYDSAIVAAESKEIAVTINPNGSGDPLTEDWGWCKPSDVQVEEIGIAKDGTTRGLILASFNAG